MRQQSCLVAWWFRIGMLVAPLACVVMASAQEPQKKASSYLPVDLKEDFATIRSRMEADKPKVIERQQALLKERYDLSNRPAQGVTMSRGKAVEEGVRYFHDGRLLTLDDTVEFFNLILELKLSEGEKSDLIAFLRQL